MVGLRNPDNRAGRDYPPNQRDAVTAGPPWFRFAGPTLTTFGPPKITQGHLGVDGRILRKKDLVSKVSKDIPADLSKRLMRGCGGESKQSTPTPARNGEQDNSQFGTCSKRALDRVSAFFGPVESRSIGQAFYLGRAPFARPAAFLPEADFFGGFVTTATFPPL